MKKTEIPDLLCTGGSCRVGSEVTMAVGQRGNFQAARCLFGGFWSLFRCVVSSQLHSGIMMFIPSSCILWYFFQFFFVSVDGRLRVVWRAHVHYLLASAVWRANKLSTAKPARINCLGHTYLPFYSYYLDAAQLRAFPENTVRCWSAFSSTSRMGIELFYSQWR